MTSHFTDPIIAAAVKSHHDFKVPASDSLAQFGVESAYGRKVPPGSCNPFGIKAGPGEPSVEAPTHEFINGVYVTKMAAFRKYADFNEAFDQHARLLATDPRYAPAMRAWAAGALDVGVRLMAQHYATSPDYATLLLAVIHGQNLQQYDAL